MRFLNWIKNAFLRVGNFNWKNIISVTSLIFTILAVYIAYLAYNTALDSIQDANAQRLVDMERSNAQFKLQMEGARKLNDSLIMQIESLQKITAEQLEVSSQMSEKIQKQLNILEASLDVQQYEGRPVISFEPSVIVDSSFIENGRYYSPMIKTRYENSGKRFAYEARFRAFVVYNQFTLMDLPKRTKVKSGTLVPNSGKPTPNSGMSSLFGPRILPQFKNDFYYCYEITYFDKGLNRYFNQVKYLHYFSTERNELDFYNCTGDEEDIIRRVINERLSYLNRPLFDQEPTANY